jgi:hypothetical protein
MFSTPSLHPGTLPSPVPVKKHIRRRIGQTAA